MAKVDVIVIRAPGTNCEHETAYAWRMAGAEASIVRINTLIANPHILDEARILTVPGGFSYGDDISGGKIWATEIDLFLSDALRSFVDSGKLVLGICNGFQVLVKAGLLPGEAFGTDKVSLGFNRSWRYEDRWVHLQRATNRCCFIDDDELMYVPVAHAEGRIVVTDESTLADLESKGFVAFRYVDERGRCAGFPVNPNASMGSIAGLTDETGQVLGLMPHPERFIHPTQHPCWTRLPRDREPDGVRMFRTAVARFR